jgi:hypothetical protein
MAELEWRRRQEQHPIERMGESAVAGPQIVV